MFGFPGLLDEWVRWEEDGLGGGWAGRKAVCSLGSAHCGQQPLMPQLLPISCLASAVSLLPLLPRGKNPLSMLSCSQRDITIASSSGLAQREEGGGRESEKPTHLQ